MADWMYSDWMTDGPSNRRYTGPSVGCTARVAQPSPTIAPLIPADSSTRQMAGFCAVSSSLPVPQNVETELVTPAVEGNGMNAAFDRAVHCIAAEPSATFLRVSVHDSNRQRQEVAYETAVLGRLRRGYRILQLRCPLGTRIELCHLFVRISFGSENNEWATPRQVRA